MIEMNPGRMMPNLRPCPICGKKPKVKYYGINSGWVYCKPIFGRKHKEVIVKYEQPSKIKLALVLKWNSEVEHEKEENA